MREINCIRAIAEGYASAMRKDPGTFIVGEGIAARGGCFGHTTGLLAEFGPERVLDMPISESAFTGMCAGAAACGSRAIVDIMYVDFLTLAMDQVVNQAAKLRYISGGQFDMPLTILGVMGAARSGGAHHSQSLYPWFMNIPGIIVVVPSNAYDLKGLLTAAILEDDLTIVLPHRGLLTAKAPVPEEDFTLPLGKARVAREGTDVTIVAASMMLHRALEAAGELAEKRVSADVIDPRTLVPLDEEAIIASVRKTGHLVVVDEGYANCGVGAEIIARVQEKAFDALDGPAVRIHALPTPIPFSPVLEKEVIPDARKIVDAVMKIL